MSLRMFSCLVLVTAICLPRISNAQEIPREVKEFLARLAGEWDITSKQGDKTMNDKLSAKMTKNNEGLIWHWGGTDIDSGATATSVGLMGWDGQKRVIVEHMISSNGVTFDATWTGSGNRWTSQTRSMELIEGEYKTAVEERVMEFESDDKMIIISKNRLLDGKPQPNTTGIFIRKK